MTTAIQDVGQLRGPFRGSLTSVLFLAGDQDRLVEVTKIGEPRGGMCRVTFQEAFQEQLRVKGVPSTLEVFKGAAGAGWRMLTLTTGSRHVQHFKREPERYMGAIVRALRRIPK